MLYHWCRCSRKSQDNENRVTPNGGTLAELYSLYITAIMVSPGVIVMGLVCSQWTRPCNSLKNGTGSSKGFLRHYVTCMGVARIFFGGGVGEHFFKKIFKKFSKIIQKIFQRYSKNIQSISKNIKKYSKKF